MDKKPLIRKCLTIGIILLFIELTVAPSINANMLISDDVTSGTRTSYFTADLGTLSGYVTDSVMNPIEGARVRVYFHETYRENYSNSTGYYHVTDIPICYCLKNATCSKDGYYPEWVLLSIAENTTYDFVLTSLNQSELDPPYGPTEGYVGVEYTFYFVIPVDPNGDEYFTQWRWGDGYFTDWLGPYVSGQTTSASHTWTDAGVYEIRVKLKNTNGTESNWSEPHIITIIESGPPVKPIIDGPSWGIKNTNYTFCVTWTDPDADNFYFMWNWGDGNISEWLGPYSAGQTICSNHSWSQKGTYTIQVKLEDEHGVEINSDPHIFNVGEVKQAFIFGRYSNYTDSEILQIFEALNLRVIYFKPFQFIHYANGEIVALDNNSPGGSVVMHSLKFVIGFSGVVIYN